MGASKILLFLCVLLIPSISHAQVIIGKDFTTKSTGAAEGDDWNIWSNGYISNNVIIPTTGDYKITVEAKGDLAGPDNPNMRVEIDGKVQNINVPTSNYSLYLLKFNITEGTHELKISFTNDYYSLGKDRNLIIKKITVENMNTTPNPCTVEDVEFTGNTTFTGTLNIKTGKGMMEFK